MEEQAAGVDQERRELGFLALLALGINGIVGVGIFFTPNLVAGLVSGIQGVLAYLLSALALLPVALVYATLGARFDQDGGPYVWARAAFGEHAGFFVGWIAYASSLLSTAAIFSGLGAYLGPVLGFGTADSQRVFAAAAAAGLFAVAALGLRPSAVVWSALTLLKLVPLALLVLAFVIAPAGAPARGGSVSFGALGFSALLYVVLHAACVRALPDLAHASAPLVAAGAALGGAALGRVLGLGANLSALGIAFGMSVMTPRYLSALAETRVFGAWLGAETRRHVPLPALGVSAALVIALLSVGALSRLFVLSSVAVLTQYAVSSCALLRLGWRRAFGCTRRQALIAPFSLLAIGALVASAELAELSVMAGVLGSGALLWFSGRVRRA